MANKLLLIDDERELTELAGSYLRLQGFEVETTNDPVDGLAKLQQGGYDAVVVDLMMVSMDGLALVRRLRETPGHGAIPVFVLSAKWLSDDERKDMLQLGVHYLKKPFNPRRFVETLRGQLPKK